MVKFKQCFKCEESKVIYKNIKGKKYCKPCSIIIEKELAKKSTKPTKKVKIDKASEKRIIKDRQYAALRKKFLETNTECVGCLPGCTGWDKSTLTIQHKRGRVGSLYLDTRYWIVLCLNCHRFTNDNPKKAIELGLAESRLKKNV